MRCRFLRLFLRKQFRRLRVHLFALVTTTAPSGCGILNLRFRLFLARDERQTLAPALPDDLGKLMDALLQSLLLLAE